MFEEGNLLFFRPFLFKNGATPENKFFLVLKKLDGDILLASLPTSKDHVPSDLVVKRGCLNIPDRMFNVFVFLAGENVAVKEDGTSFAFHLHRTHYLFVSKQDGKKQIQKNTAGTYLPYLILTLFGLPNSSRSVTVSHPSCSSSLQSLQSRRTNIFCPLRNFVYISFNQFPIC